jgi:hypothetical protein
MKSVIVICIVLMTSMVVLTAVSYQKYKASEEHEIESMQPDINMNYISDTTIMPEWCNDRDYVDTVVIPLQEDIYNMDFQTDDYEDETIKNIICQDTESCGVHETLYNKSLDARNFNIQLIKLDKKLDSLETETNDYER